MGDRKATNRITFVGHATVLLELDGARLLTDPLLRGQLGHLRRHGPPPAAGVGDALDAVLISHLHRDHLDLASLRRLDADTPLLAPRGAGAMLRRAGFIATQEVAPGDAVEVGDVTVTATPAIHDDRRSPFGGPRAEAVGFVVSGKHSIYFAGDTDIFETMRDIGPGLDVALLPVWGWGPTIGSGHLDPEGAARAAEILRPRIAVPIHWGTFYPRGVRTRDRLTTPPRVFATSVAQIAPDVEVRVLEPGESLVLDD